MKTLLFLFDRKTLATSVKRLAKHLDIEEGQMAGIILHHLTQTVTQYGQIYKSVIVVMVYLGVYFTGMFFFFSGYGLYTSFLNKEDYLKNFLRKRLPAVLILFYTTNTIFVVVSLIMGYEMSVQEGLLYISGLVLLNSQFIVGT